jgi:hypothetical protein
MLRTHCTPKETAVVADAQAAAQPAAGAPGLG